MSDPILFVVDDDAVTLASLAGALEQRFGPDYRALSDRSPRTALARLRRVCEEGEVIALLVADQWMPEMTGIDWLGRARERARAGAGVIDRGMPSYTARARARRRVRSAPLSRLG